MLSFRSASAAIACLAFAICLTACRKKPASGSEITPAEAAPPAESTEPAVTPAPDGAPPPPTVAETTTVGVDYSKMSNEDKYMSEMADSITSFIQDHLRNRGRMPKDAQDVVALKIMSRVDVPDAYILVIDQKTGKATFKRKKK
jgi:PBP1b-binding outer membrane lipoprotein LpoB